jgi:hypothetical protein
MKTIQQTQAANLIAKALKAGYSLQVAISTVTFSYQVDGGIEGAVAMVKASK